MKKGNPHRIVLIALLAVGFATHLVACGGGEADLGVGPARGEEDAALEVSELPPEIELDPEPLQESQRAKAALEAVAGFGGGTGIEEKKTALSREYLVYLSETAWKERTDILQMEGKGRDEFLKRLKEKLAAQGMKVVIDGDFLDQFSKETEEKSKALFGVGSKALKEKKKDEVFELWLGMNWEKRIRPDMEGRVFASERDFVSRITLFYVGGGRKKEEFTLLMEEGRYRYAGSRKEREAYVRGPERATLFEWKSEAEKREAAEMDLSELQSGLLSFKQHMERYPSVIEGLEVLLTKVSGPESQKWLGPYAHHIHDPWGNRFRLKVPGSQNPDYYDIWSPGADGEDGTDDDIKNW
ncbi:MAG: type II secretion system protein GspG [Planctomycetota bacterium]|jgi:type II secretion system protein G